jgi:hypothetical protein
MGEGDKRTRRTARYDSRELALLTRKQSPSEAEWDEKVAVGSQELPVAPAEARTTTLEDPLTTSLLADEARTKTVDDPLTTSLLAEVARRRTVEIDPDDIDEEIDLPPADTDPADRS